MATKCVRFLHAQQRLHAPQDPPAIEAQAMKSKTGGKNRRKVGRDNKRQERSDHARDKKTAPPEAPLDSEDDGDIDEPDPNTAEDDRWDDRWDVFILDDGDHDPLPDYGDFWFPD